jgi:hypothetical protein
MTDLAPTRTLDGVELPVPGTWVIDPLHTSLGFEARHAAVTRMRGHPPPVLGGVRSTAVRHPSLTRPSGAR